MISIIISLLAAKAFADILITGQDGVVKTCGETLTGTLTKDQLIKLEFTLSNLANKPKITFDSCKSGTNFDTQLKVVTKVGYTQIAKGQEGSDICSGYRDILVATPNDGLEDAVKYELEIYPWTGESGNYEIQVRCGVTQVPTSRPTLRPTNRPIPKYDRDNLIKCNDKNTEVLLNYGPYAEAKFKIREIPNLSSSTGQTEGIACVLIPSRVSCSDVQVTVDVAQNDYDSFGEKIYSYFEKNEIGECGGGLDRKFCTATECFEGLQDQCGVRLPCPFEESVGSLNEGTYPIQLITTTGVDVRGCGLYSLDADITVRATGCVVAPAGNAVSENWNNSGTKNIIELDVTQLLLLVGGICGIIVVSITIILLIYNKCIKTNSLNTSKVYNKIGYTSSSADESTQLN